MNIKIGVYSISVNQYTHHADYDQPIDKISFSDVVHSAKRENENLLGFCAIIGIVL